MRNELLLIGSVVLIYGAVLAAYRFFGKTGLFAMTAVTIVLVNIEALLLVEAFGIVQTLGNVLFASTYLITDILSENEGKKEAARAVWLGIFISGVTLLLTQYWLLYLPAAEDWAREHITHIFTTTPRMLTASLTAYIISQVFDVWLYHWWWNFTEKKFGSRSRFLWLRNNASTMVSQILNTVIFTLAAFWGRYSWETLLSIMVSSYIIFIFTSLLDTPAIYLSRHVKKSLED